MVYNKENERYNQKCSLLFETITISHNSVLITLVKLLKTVSDVFVRNRWNIDTTRVEFPVHLQTVSFSILILKQETTTKNLWDSDPENMVDDQEHSLDVMYAIAKGGRALSCYVSHWPVPYNTTLVSIAVLKFVAKLDVYAFLYCIWHVMGYWLLSKSALT